jgi:TrmH family RNA methyltransferase
MEYVKYNSSLNYSYVFGAFGTIELLENKAKECLSIIVDPSFVNNEAFSKIKALCKSNNIPIVIDLKIINKIRDKGNIFVVGVFKKYESMLNNNKHLVLHGINDVGVIGTIIRSMRGFNFENLVLIDCNVDLYHEHLIRSTMGAFFQTNIKRYLSFESYKKEYSNLKFVNISNIGKPLSSIKNSNELSLIFSLNPINDETITHICFKEDISLDNIVNIVLFNLYS